MARALKGAVMERSFGKSMALLHTWTGVLLGALLFTIFWMGTLSVFDREIDRWMMPDTRLTASAGAALSLDRAARTAVSIVPAGTVQWRLDLPTARVPVLRLSYPDQEGNTVVRHIDPVSYALIPDQGTKGGTGFIFPFHYSLHVEWQDIGEWIVGLAAMAMLVLLASGVIIHKKIFAQFFTFRPKMRLQRSDLDLHNLTGVLGLPFHFVIVLSGLIILIGVYFPKAHVGAYGSGAAAKAAYTAEARGIYKRPAADMPGALASLDAMAARATREWSGGQPYMLRVWHPGDINSYVELRRSYAHDITMNLDQIYFDAFSGAVLHRFEAAPVMSAQRFISGLHFIQFEHWTLRWLYFFAGLSGCVMITTGLLFWIEARGARHAKRGSKGARIVEGLTTGGVTGIVIATLAFFAANRLLPLEASFAGQARATQEMWAFYLAWIACFVHAWRRPRAAWREQCRLICALALACVMLNVATTGDHLLRTTASGMWAVAGMDAMLLVLALLSAWAARRLGSAATQGAVAGGRRVPVAPKPRP